MNGSNLFPNLQDFSRRDSIVNQAGEILSSFAVGMKLIPFKIILTHASQSCSSIGVSVFLSATLQLVINALQKFVVNKHFCLGFEQDK